MTTSTGTITTYYPTKFYNITNGIPTKHIFANGVEVATIVGSGSTSTVSYILTDHLTGSNVITNASGTISELTDYYPYGATRIDNQLGFNEQRKFAGHEFDPSTGLSYMGARYYNLNNGRFLSEDQVFLEIGTQEFDQNLLTNPQSINSYSYVLNNPLKRIDPDGKCPVCFGVAAGLLAAAPAISNYAAQFTTPIGQIFTNLAVDNVRTIRDPKASIGQKTWAGLGIAGAIFPEERALVKGFGSAEKAINQFPVGASFGKYGKVMENTYEGIAGFTRHGLDQAISRSVSPATLLETVRNPLVTLRQDGGTRLFLSEKAVVVLNDANKIVTTYGKDLFVEGIKKVLRAIVR